jgi:PAS domain S-box-containing protein
MADSAVSPVRPESPSDLDVLTSMNLAFDLSPVSMILVDDGLRIVKANPAAHQMLAADPLIGRSVTEFSVAENVARADGENQSWLSGELTHLERETDLAAGTGETLQAVVRVDAIVLPSGCRYFLAQLRDVTAERRQERELAASEARYRQLAENLPDTSVMLFDRDLRLIIASGEALVANGYTNELAGTLMRDVFPASGMDLLEGPYRAALAGRATDFRYDSPIGGRHFRARARPVFDRDGQVVGGLSVMEDVTADQALATQLKQIHQFGHFGGSWYDRRSGWSYSDTLLELWGIDADPAGAGLPVGMLAPEGRATESYSWSRVLTESGRHSLSYSMVHGSTGEVRHLQCTASSVVDAAGVLMHVVATHVDVTDAVIASRRAELEQLAAAQERSQLLRQLGDMLATSRLGPEELLQVIVDLAAATIGEGAAIRILSPDLRTVERDVAAHPDESVRLRLVASLQRSARDPVPGDGPLAELLTKGKLLSDFRQRDWRPEYQRIFTERVFDQAAHVMVAPVRHNGVVLGKLAVFRTDPGTPYRAGDDDVLQLLADGAGAAIAENRTWLQGERERDGRLTELRERHLELLEKLAGMETRERSLLAEAIHDEPIQRIVAGILRLDHLSTRLDPVARNEVDQVTEQLVTTVDWLRDLIVVALSPPDLSAGLGPALAGLARGIFTATPTVFTVVGPDHVPLGVPAKEAVYRIFREALGNVRKHARANNATLGIEQRDGLIVVSLTDDGVGSASLDAGAGHLGMATMRARAEAEGGQLHIESVPGLGTVVTLTLPTVPKLPSQPKPAMNGAVALAPADLDPLRTIVVCDDHHYLRDAVISVLATLPRFRIVGTASTGKTCLRRVRDLRPDVLILDVSMPSGGPDLAKAAKELNPAMHIVVFSGRQDERTRTAMLAAGADQYVVKTGRLQPLIAALDLAVAAVQELNSKQS